MPAIELSAAPLEPWRRLAEHERQRAELAGRYGATGVFVGTMRDVNEDDAVVAMHLEHYPGMTERHLGAICAEAERRWSLLDILVVHRIGEVRPNDPIVLVAAWSAHRRDAFEASRFIMEDLKSKAPFWKKEQLADGGERWVEKNSPGY